MVASGTQPLAYQWQFNSSDIPGQTNSSFALLNAGPSQQGGYAVRITNPAGFTNGGPALLTVISPPASFVAYVTPGSVYSQDFNSLPNPGIASVNADNPVKIGAASYGLANPFDFTFPILPNSVDINSGIGLGGLALSNAMPGWYALSEIAPKLGACAGDQSTGGAISFGSTNSINASTNRALGLLATSSTGSTAFGLKLINQTTVTLNQITVYFTGELWRQAAVAKSLSVSYFVDPTITNTFTINATALLTNLDVNFAADVSAINSVPVDGVAAANQMSLGTTNQLIVDWPPGAALWLTWQMSDAAGKGQGLAIDNLSFSASASQIQPPAQLSIRQSGTNVVLSWSAAPSGFLLQANSSLSQPAAWAPVPQPVIVTNGSNSMLVPIVPTDQFYRLKK